MREGKGMQEDRQEEEKADLERRRADGSLTPTHVSPDPCWRGGFVYSLVHSSQLEGLGTGMREEIGHHGEHQTSWLRHGIASTGVADRA